MAKTNPVHSAHFLHKRLSASSTVVMAAPFLLALAFASSYVFLGQIGDFYSGDQSSYLIDAYYYIYLGQRALSDSLRTGTSLLVEAYNLAPNRSSTGIIFVSSLLQKLFFGAYALNIFFVAQFSAFCWLMIRYRRASKFILVIFCTGLAPYAFLPTKEAVFFSGVLLSAIPTKSLIKPAALLSGLTLMFFARPEAVAIFLIAYAIFFLLTRGSVLRWVSVIFLILFYFLQLRSPLLSVSRGYEMQYAMIGEAFCHVGPLEVCVRGAAIPELIYLQRLLTLPLFPLIWIYRFAEVIISPGSFTYEEIMIRISFVSQIAVALLLVRGVSSGPGRAHLGVKIFVISYIFVYMSVLFFQAGRQVVFAMDLYFLMSQIGYGFPYERSALNPRVRDGLGTKPL